MERVKGIEPSSQAWEARILPLNHTRLHHSYLLTELSKGGNSHFVIFGSDSRLFFVFVPATSIPHQARTPLRLIQSSGLLPCQRVLQEPEVLFPGCTLDGWPVALLPRCPSRYYPTGPQRLIADARFRGGAPSA